VPRSQTACFWKTTAGLDAPNFYAYSHQGPDASPENAARFKPPAASWTLAVGMRPKSRGCHLTGSDPADPVKIDANYLGDPHNIKDLVAGLTLARKLGNSAALRPYSGGEIAPGSLNAEDLARAFFPRRAWYFLASVRCRKNGPRCHVRRRREIEGLQCRRPPHCRCFDSASRNDRQHDGPLRCDRRAGGSTPAADRYEINERAVASVGD
jgi:hypothetical protein